MGARVYVCLACGHKWMGAMSQPPSLRSAIQSITLWSDHVRRCELHRRDGRFEVLLHDGDHVSQLHVCDSEHAARGKAQEWLCELEEASIDRGRLA